VVSKNTSIDVFAVNPVPFTVTLTAGGPKVGLTVVTGAADAACAVTSVIAAVSEASQPLRMSAYSPLDL
jgi:hypothetical protein